MKSLFSFLFVISLFANAQHTISGTFTPAEGFSNIFLYKSTSTGSTYIDRSEVQPDGSFSIPLDANASAGIYKLVYNLPAEENNFDLFYNAKENIVLRFETDKELVFEESRQNIAWNTYLKEITVILNRLNAFYSEGNTDKTQYLEIVKELKELQNNYEKDYTGEMAGDFINSNRPYIPSDYESIGTYFNHVRENFLKPIDFNNRLLQSSDFLTEKVMIFVFDLVSNPNDAFYKEQIDRLVPAMGEDRIIKTQFLSLIWNRFVAMDNDNLANYITDTYLATLAKQTHDDALLNTITTHKKTSIGTIAINFDIPITENGVQKTTTLLDLEGSKEYLLVFWGSTCGHCLNEMPKLRDYLKQVPQKDLTVIAFAMEDSEHPWQEVIKNYPDFIHVLGLEKWDNPVSDLYGVEATPSYFLLDKDKKIMAKPYDVEALKKYISINQ